MSETWPDGVVSTSWLALHLDDPQVRIVDSTWYLPNAGRDGRADYEAGHIPGAVFWDLDAIADPADPLPHMLPSADGFKRHMEALGIGDDSFVVAYDQLGIATSGRPWWMLRYFGHDKVAVLDGGMVRWKAEARPVATGVPAPRAASFTPRPRAALVRTLDQMRANLSFHAEQVFDARSAGRFSGTMPEPRPNCRPGHIPGAFNLPIDRLVDPDRKTMKSIGHLEGLVVAAGIDLDRPVTTSCGSGVTASTLALGLYLLGRKDVAVYDGSWSEWGSRTDTPVET
jgi:thiosulfate/3-mercaptopyruvate sulfurtransferase